MGLFGKITKAVIPQTDVYKAVDKMAELADKAQAQKNTQNASALLAQAGLPKTFGNLSRAAGYIANQQDQGILPKPVSFADNIRKAQGDFIEERAAFADKYVPVAASLVGGILAGAGAFSGNKLASEKELANKPDVKSAEPIKAPPVPAPSKPLENATKEIFSPAFKVKPAEEILSKTVDAVAPTTKEKPMGLFDKIGDFLGDTAVGKAISGGVQQGVTQLIAGGSGVMTNQTQPKSPMEIAYKNLFPSGGAYPNSTTTTTKQSAGVPSWLWPVAAVIGVIVLLKSFKIF